MVKQNNKGIIVLLVIIIIILSVLCVLFATNTINFKNKERNNSQNIAESNNQNQISKENNTSNNNISEEKLKNIINNELFVLFKHSDPVTKKEDIDNESKLLVALNILKNEYTTSSNDIYTTIENFTKTKLEEAFNSSVISDLGIQHESFNTYELVEDNIYRNTNLYSKDIYKYRIPLASKVKNYEKTDNKYVISMNYLFPDDNVGFQYYYGSLTDSKNKTNSIVKASDDNDNYFDAQEYLDNNYNNIKDKLATYNYTFEITNNKITFVDFSIN